MKKYRCVSLLLCLCLCVSAFAGPLTAAALYSLPEGTAISAGSAMVVYLEATASGEEAVQNGRDTIVFEKDADVLRSPAAVVRLMVGLYAVRRIREDNLDLDTVTGTFTEDLRNNYVWGTGLGTANMEVGETWTLRDLLSLSMIQTAADACVTLAVTIDGSIRNFVDGMNELAAEIGCTNTTFANVTGLDDARQKTTARDLYILTRVALDYPEMETMLSATEHTVHPVSGGEERSWENTNYMLRATSQSYYSPVQLGKTGYGDEGRSLVSVAQDSGYRYMVIVLSCPDTGTEEAATAHYDDSRALYKWAFQSFTYKQIYSQNQLVDRHPVSLAWDVDSVTLVTATSLSCLVANEVDTSTVYPKITYYQDSLEAPVEKGTPLGKMELFIQMDQKIGEVELVAGESVARSEALNIWESVKAFFKSPWFWAVVGLLVVLILAYIVLLFVHNRNKRKAARRNVRKKKYKSLK